MRSLVINMIMLPLLLLGSCTERIGHVAGEEEGLVRAVFHPDDNVSGMAGCHFRNGVLVHVYDVFHEEEDGYGLKVAGLYGTLYLVAWSGEGRPYEDLPQGFPETEWLHTVVSGQDMFMTGSADLSAAATGRLPVVMRRGMARFDLVLDVEGEVTVRKAIIHSVMKQGWLFPQEELSPVPGAAVGDVDLAPFAYLHEQSNPDLRVEVAAVVDGREYILEAALPREVRRNTRYSVTLRRDSQNQELCLEVVPWEDGGTSDAFPDRSGVLAIDPDRSGLPEGAILAEDGRMLTLSHSAVEFDIRMSGDEELELVSAEGYLLEVLPVPADNALDMNVFRIRKSLYAPGVEGSDVRLQFRRKGLSHIYPDDCIVLRLSPNPVVVQGPMDFDTEGYVHDFARYVDNELGIVTLPEGSSLSVEYAAGEDPWVRVDPMGENTWRILGGWRPNDPNADGRRQEAVLVISDGKNREEYTVARRNYGLPVTWLHGIWWCKYNAMGQSDSFEDQILVPEDPAVASGMSVYDYLASCTPEEYRELWQWAYQGSSGRGLKVVEQDGKLVMDGFSTTVADHINKLPADALSPDGYELPSMEDFNRIFDATDYVWIMWNGTHTLKNPWEGHSLIKRENRRKNNVEVDGMAISDLISIAMWSPDFPEHEAVVWYGPGAQWNTDGIQHAGHYNNILFGVASPEGSGWYMAGGMNAFYLHKNGAGNIDTRVLRFRKSDVEYVY